eukprot:SAG22_NODE_1650_length_3897_cov_2.043181_2_plen_240_part_00
MASSNGPPGPAANSASDSSSSSSLFRPTGKPLPQIRMTTSQSLIAPALFAPIVPGKNSLAKRKEAEHKDILGRTFQDTKKCEGMTKVLRKHTFQLMQDVHFLKDCFKLLDEDHDGKLSRRELQRWIEIMSGSEPKDCYKEYKINWEDDIDDLLESLDITDLGAFTGRSSCRRSLLACGASPPGTRAGAVRLRLCRRSPPHGRCSVAAVLTGCLATDWRAMLCLAPQKITAGSALMSSSW